MVFAGGATEFLMLDPQFADGALTNQLALAILERSDSLYQVPEYEARVHRWVPCWPPMGLRPSWFHWPLHLACHMPIPHFVLSYSTVTAGAIPRLRLGAIQTPPSQI